MKSGKVKLIDICNQLSEDSDNAVSDAFYRGAKSLMDNQGKVDLSNAEFQLYIRDFIEQREATKDYQLDIFKPILLQYYDSDYDLIDESIELPIMEKKITLSAEELFEKYKKIARDTYELEWNSADREEKKELAKKAVSIFVQQYPEVRNVIKEFAAILEDENYNTDREAFNDLYKFESKKYGYSKRLVKEEKEAITISANGITEKVKTKEEKSCFEAAMKKLSSFENNILDFGVDLKDKVSPCWFTLGSPEGEQWYAVEFKGNNEGKVDKIYTVADNILLTNDFVKMTKELSNLR